MRKRLLLMLGMLAFCLQLLAQTRTITGRVTDAQGNGIPNASVTVPGGNAGTTTQTDGSFTLTVPTNATRLIATSVGYGDQEIDITGASTVQASLTRSDRGLEEVVVVGYGTQRRASSTGSVSSIKAKAFDQVPIASFDNILQGKAPGVQVTAQSGQPGAAAYIRVRGVGSLNAGQQPLIVVDGVPTANLNLINPNDIADVSILKDAASASIYGSRGSNGVILVTTKKGRANRPQLTYRFQYGQKKKTSDNFELMSAAEKLQYEYDIEYANEYVDQAIEERGLTGDLFTISETDRQSIWNSLIGNEVDWKKQIFRTANLSSHELALSGGSDKVTYYFSGNAYNEEGIVVSSNFKRISSHLNVEYKPYNWVRIGTDALISFTNDNLIRDRYNAQNPVYASYAYNPYETPKLPDSSWNYTSQGFNVLEALENNPEKTSRVGTLGSVFIELNPIKSLTLRSQVGLNYVNYEREYFIKPNSILDQYVGDPGARGSKTDNGSQDFTRIWTNTATWDKKLRDVHNVNVLVGSEFNDNQFKSYSFSSKGFPSGNVSTQQNASTPTEATSARSDWALFSLFARGRYNYDEKYFVEATVRRDGSSRFGVNKKYGNFWATGIGWAISNEDFFKNVSAVSLLKLRASVGTAGNFNIGNYQTYGLYQYVSYNGQSASVPSQVANPDLTWESNFNYDIGLDFAAFSNRLSGSLEYYNRKTSDLLADVPKSRTSGFTSRLENVGEMTNKGVEVSLGYDIIRNKNFTWNMTGMFTRNVNRITKLYGETDELFVGFYTKFKVGEPQNVFFLNQWAGVDPATGAPQYFDADGKVTTEFSGDDAVELSGKSPDPKFYGSYVNTLSFKKLSLNVEFYYSGGGHTYNQVYADLLSDGQGFYQNQAKDALNYWKKEGDIAPNPNPISAGYTVQTTDRFLEKTDFIRLRNVTLSYGTPVNITNKFSLQNVRFYVQGQNLLTFTDFHGDPEVGLGSAEQTYNRPGEYTLYTYPQTRALTVGVDITF